VVPPGNSWSKLRVSAVWVAAHQVRRSPVSRSSRPALWTRSWKVCPVGESTVGERVWLVWEDDDVLGVYNDPTTAAADCGALRRHAHRNQLGVHYQSMAVPVLNGRRHQPGPVADQRASS